MTTVIEAVEQSLLASAKLDTQEFCAVAQSKATLLHDCFANSVNCRVWSACDSPATSTASDDGGEKMEPAGRNLIESDDDDGLATPTNEPAARRPKMGLRWSSQTPRGAD